MAKLAGLDLRERWADWNQTPFTADSTSHISVWQNRTARAAEPQSSEQNGPTAEMPRGHARHSYNCSLKGRSG